VKSNLISATTCDKREMELLDGHLAGFLRRLPQANSTREPWFFHPSRKNEGIATASKVQYVMEGYNFKKLGYAWNGKMRVLNQVLSRDWLQNRIRVIGGAYGGYASVTPSGFFSFNSYRDPNLRETLENYSGTTDYLRQFDADQKAMSRYIIGTISSIDQPLTASQKGNQAVNLYFTKRLPEDIQRDRNDILSVTAEDIRSFSGMIQAILDQNNICVYGNEDKINSEKSLFDQIIKLEREK
jgi:hypothetical protein